MADIPWLKAIIEVLKQSKEAMHYTEIAEKIVELELKNKIGATPANTVNAYINSSINKEGAKSPFAKVSPGEFILKEFLESAISFDPQAKKPGQKKKSDNELSAIGAYGMFWRRDKIVWGTKPRLLGIQIRTANEVDFSEQKGVYLLYDLNPATDYLFLVIIFS